MEKTKEQKAEDILAAFSEMMGVKVEILTDEKNQGLTQRAFDVDSIIAQFWALLVYLGVYVPSHAAPPYNRVHAGVEYWKKKFESSPETGEAVPAEAEPAPPAAQ